MSPKQSTAQRDDRDLEQRQRMARAIEVADLLDKGELSLSELHQLWCEMFMDMQEYSGQHPQRREVCGDQAACVGERRGDDGAVPANEQAGEEPAGRTARCSMPKLTKDEIKKLEEAHMELLARTAAQGAAGVVPLGLARVAWRW